jgi:ABC-type multidrug transport system fused ATPase/permease subunit
MLKNLIKKYFQSFVYFYKRLGYKLFFKVGISISVGLLDGFGLAMFLPLLQMADGSSGSAKGLGNLKFLVDGMSAIGLSVNLSNTLIIMTMFFVLKGGAQYASAIYELRLRQFFIKTIRLNLSYSLSRMQYKIFVTSDAGRIQNTMSGEVDKISQAYQNYFGAFQGGIMVAVYMLFAFLVDPRFAVLICVGGGLTNIVFRSIYKATKKASNKLVKHSNLYQNLILQFTNNFKYLKATGFIREYNEKLNTTIEYIQENNLKIGKLGAVVTATREPLLIFIVSSVIYVQVNLLGGALGSILISLLFFYRALGSLVQMQTAYNNFMAVSGSMENMTNFEHELRNAQEKTGKESVSQFNGTLEVKNAYFNYSDKSILSDINLRITKNQTVAFVGESGSGKTTLVNILAGLMPMTKGEVLVDGISIKDIDLDSYGKRIGYITQEPVIFGDTIFNNITLWADPTVENLQRYANAIQQASLNEFIDNLPEKELAMLGNNGVNLSGGQRQRISIARELYKDIDLLVLDEATSALDSETEKIIQRGIEELHGKYTILIVAHRLSTIKNADHIIVMSKGEIVEAGNFDDLASSSSKFKKMVEFQKV